MKRRNEEWPWTARLAGLLVALLPLLMTVDSVAGQTIEVGPALEIAVVPGAQVTFPIEVDMSGAAGLNIASLQFVAAWDPGQLGYVGDVPQSPPPGDWTVLVNRDDVNAGILAVGMFSLAGTTNSFDAIQLTLEAGASIPTGTWSLIDMTVAAAGDFAGGDVTQAVVARDVWLCIGISGIMGDVTDDGAVNIIDAQQVARYAVGLPTPGAPKIEIAGDVTEDGSINIIDAQQIARYSVGLPAPAAPRIAEVLAGCEGEPTGFDIEIMHLSSPSTSQAQAFANATARWMSLVVGEIPDVDFTSVPFPANACGLEHPEVSQTVDDLLIFARLEPIDGPGNILGAAGPCYLRDGSWHPAIGIMFFDTADLEMLETQDLLEVVVLHEMGHVIGIGSIWNLHGFLQNPSDPNRGGTPFADTHFNGAAAVVAFDAVGGTVYTDGEKVPVENNNSIYGSGSLDVHWREAVFNNELMSPSINLGFNPLSIVTVASLEDVGYTVDASGVDAYTLPIAGGLKATGPSIVLQRDVWWGPRYVGDARGHVIRVLAEPGN